MYLYIILSCFQSNIRCKNLRKIATYCIVVSDGIQTGFNNNNNNERKKSHHNN